MLIAVVLGTWFVMSVPVALVVGRLIRVSTTDGVAPDLALDDFTRASAPLVDLALP